MAVEMPDGINPPTWRRENERGTHVCGVPLSALKWLPSTDSNRGPDG
jgi:hypothetical protein